MSQNDDPIFSDPYADDADDDIAVGPEEEFAEDELGASPVEDARKPKRRKAILMIAGALVVLLGVLFVATRGGSGDRPVAREDSSVVDEQERAMTEQEAREQAAEDDPLRQRPNPREAGDRLAPGEDELIDTDDLGDDDLTFDAGGSDDTTDRPRPVDDVLAEEAGDTASARRPNPFTRAPDTVADQGTTRRPTEAGGDRLTDAQRRARNEAARQARLAEEERLRGQQTMIASGNVDLSSRNQGASRFRATAGSAGAMPDTLAPSGSSGRQAYNILPGTKVRAVTTSQFISDQQGAGDIAVRLAQPLRNADGNVILPVGTRGFGDASASGGAAAGRDPRITMTIDVFVKPDGTVLRGELSGVAADPQTLARSIQGDVDHRYPERLLRGAASTALDLALTSGADDRRSAFEAPSPRDQAINDARERVAAIIEGPVGDERSIRPAVTLDAETEFVLLFGL